MVGDTLETLCTLQSSVNGAMHRLRGAAQILRDPAGQGDTYLRQLRRQRPSQSQQQQLQQQSHVRGETRRGPVAQHAGTQTDLQAKMISSQKGQHSRQTVVRRGQGAFVMIKM